MAWLFGDGFDHYDTATLQAGAKWQVNDSPQILNNGRRSGNALDIDNVAEGLQRSVSVSGSTVIFGMAVYLTVNTPTNSKPFFGLRSSAGIQCCVAFAVSTNELLFYRGTASGTLVYSTGVALGIGAYNYIEGKIKVDASAGELELRVNGVVAGTIQTGLNTQGQADASISAVLVGGGLINQSSGTPDYRVDDFYCCDASGSFCNDFLGDIRADLLLPDGAGTYQQWPPSTGTDHHAVIDENPPNTSDYLSNSTNGQQDSSTLTAPGTTLVGIKCVQVNNYVLKDDAGLALVQNLIRSDGVDETGPTFGVSTSPLYSVSKHETDPATSAAWTHSAILALEAGIKNVTA